MSRRPPAPLLDERPERTLERHLIALLSRMGAAEDPDLQQVIGLLCRRVRAGDVCLRLDELGREDAPFGGDGDDDDAAAPRWHDLAALPSTLRASPLVGDGHTPRPLVLDPGGRLYLHRYWHHEHAIGQRLQVMASAASCALEASWLHPELDRLFGPAPRDDEVDWQRVAAVVALLRPLCVISGGPGTGKTFTVTKILALLVGHALAHRLPIPRMSLMAPTGKAAHRLVESIRAAKARLPCRAEILEAIPEQASTVHRALGAIPGQRTRFRHGADSPLPADLVLVDEASMVDVGLMARLLAALRPHARLILLGDRDQLASVEAGAVLGDLCNSPRSLRWSTAMRTAVEDAAATRLPAEAPDAASSAMGDGVVTLRRSYRHAAGQAIAELARAINTGDGDLVVDGLRAGRWPGATWNEAGADGPGLTSLLELAAAHFEPLRGATDAAAALRLHARFRILCAHRRGPGGAAVINRRLEQRLLGAVAASAGRPILVTQNDYGVHLFNGDVGVLWPDSQGLLRACFEGGEDGALRVLAPSWLPPHETVYAMTVHKSQGSEFDEVAVVLPPVPSPVLTVELLYTAVTRARTRVTLLASEAVLRHAVGRRVQRSSGLRAALWGEDLAGFG